MGRVAGVDYGKKRVGIAISDTSRRIAIPHTVVKREEFLKRMKELIGEKDIDTVVFGLPLSMSGKELELSEEIRRVAQQLKRETGVRVILKDERFTSKIVEGKFGKKGPIDHYSAGVILQEYLDFGGGEEVH